ncbi:transmembrane protein 11-B, mitochondrial [Diaphorina citri]|uniref:Transmembrane protein 11-B, mitochondrial n=1 Tax=Diaphorina citri TaxID=121845 RepID=A0A3Q0IJZ9_DIACI|nr:transmembrane protein 11-B, mitochondrial [Diaphorina citri]
MSTSLLITSDPVNSAWVSDEEKLYYIISEVYDGDSDGFELQLDNALDENYKIIIIEPSKLGDETTRWIAVGNWIHKVAVFSGLGSITVDYFPNKLHTSV